MGVYTQKLHRPMTALAAIAALSATSGASTDMCFSSLVSATGQILLSSSFYAPIATSSFDSDFTLSNSLATISISSGQPPLRSSDHATQSSVSLSGSSALRFHKAESATEFGRFCSQAVPKKVDVGLDTSRSSMRQLYRSFPLTLLDSSSTCNITATLLPSYRSIHNNLPPTIQRWRTHCQAHDYSRFPVSRLPHSRHLEKSFMNIYHALVNSPVVDSTALLHMWHGPANNSHRHNEEQFGNHKASVAVVLLGWLGAEHRHLKKYVDWYTSRGIHAVTFVVPMKDLATLKAGDKAEKHVEVLTESLLQWLKDDVNQDDEKIVIFHSFSNTGWLTYGAVLERLIGQGDHVLEQIRGCVVDSAPSARPDPRVWASGFSAALLKKGSAATRMVEYCDANSCKGELTYPKTSLKESALLSMLESFFSFFLQMPYVNRRLNEIVSVLTNQQPACPQLYIYSSADIVIPAASVESFIEQQKRAGRMVQSCNFQCSPHVDHFRTFPEKYSEQLTSFLKLCMP
ncbi:hypothetical protein KP509_23G009000 [Ceratopteris richardii]|uniref:Transmembrane protein 53 n=1 Tax=Ceratopteris richardii TaxID=49495 RepID=A0A8T2RX23_CERRI|nr:hypothetical protein KP509_23G009000 [Ceratopteris richardii]KAH7301036.1 hypothetical protein KP509_23G009000 [Ceratopteris richardii]